MSRTTIAAMRVRLIHLCYWSTCDRFTNLHRLWELRECPKYSWRTGPCILLFVAQHHTGTQTRRSFSRWSLTQQLLQLSRLQRCCGGTFKSSGGPRNALRTSLIMVTFGLALSQCRFVWRLARQVHVAINRFHGLTAEPCATNTLQWNPMNGFRLDLMPEPPS